MALVSEIEGVNLAIGNKATRIVSVTTAVTGIRCHGFRVLEAAKLHTLTGPTIDQTETAAGKKYVDTTAGNCIELPVGYTKIFDKSITAIQLHSGAIELLDR